MAQSAKVPDAPPLEGDQGPWFDNNLATLEVRGRGLVIRDSGAVRDEAYDEPELRQVARVVIQ